MLTRAQELAMHDSCRHKWIAELRLKIALCDASGWPINTPMSCRAWFTEMWPNYTPKKEYEQKIYELQRELNITPDVPRHVSLCPLTHEQGKAVNAKFESLAGL